MKMQMSRILRISYLLAPVFLFGAWLSQPEANVLPTPYWQYLLAFFLFAAAAFWGYRLYTQPAARSGARPDFLGHLHPVSIPAAQARWSYTLGMGVISVTLFGVLLFTGGLIQFFYVPTPEQAAESTRQLSTGLLWGSLVRGLHYWAAQLLVCTAGLHLLRVVFTGAFARPRRFNFLLGMALFIIIFLLNFSGHILRWDETSHWALTACLDLLRSIPWIGNELYRMAVGGNLPGAATLTRFFAWHTFVLPGLMSLGLGWHLFRMRRNGGISAPPVQFRASKERVHRSELMRREFFLVLVTLAVLVLLGSLFPPEFAASIQDPTREVTNEQAPWFFGWVQQLLRYGDTFWMGIGIPLGTIVIAVLLPWLVPDLPDEQKGIWFPPAGRVAQFLIIVLTIFWLVLTILEFQS